MKLRLGPLGLQKGKSDGHNNESGTTTIPETSPQQLNDLWTIRWRDDTSRCSRYDTEFLASAWRLDNAMDECYDNELSEKSYNADRKINSKKYPL